MNGLPENAELIASDALGIYIPKQVCRWYPEHFFHEEREILKHGPSHEEYWQTWEDAMDREFIHPDGRRGYLYEDGDLWFVPQQ